MNYNVTAEIKGKVEAQQEIMSGENQIARYNEFFDVCANIQSLEYSLDAQYALLENAEDQDRVRYNIAALEAQRARQIAQYNADSNKSYTWGQFRDSDLPYQLDATPYQNKGEKTKCANCYQ